MRPSDEQMSQQVIRNAEAIKEHGVNFIQCCHQQKMVKNGKVKNGEDRFVCVHCGIVLTGSTTEESPIIICGERELIDLRRRIGLNELADRLECLILQDKSYIPDEEIIIDELITKPKRNNENR